MSQPIASAYAEVGLRDASLTAGLDRMLNKVMGFQSTLVGVFAGGAIVGALAGFTARITRVASELDALNDRARETGVSVSKLSELEFAGRMSGVENVSGMLNFLQKNLGLAAEGNKELSASFQKLGIDAAAFVRGGGDVTQLLAHMLDQFQEMGPAKAHALATSVLGRSGFSAMKLGTGAELLSNIQAGRDSGATVSAREAAKADEMFDELEKLSTRLESMWREVGDPIIEAFGGFVAKMNTELAGTSGSRITDYLHDFGEGAASVVDVLGDAVQRLAGVSNALSSAFDDILSGKLNPVAPAMASASTELGASAPIASLMAWWYGVDSGVLSGTVKQNGERDDPKDEFLKRMREALTGPLRSPSPSPLPQVVPQPGVGESASPFLSTGFGTMSGAMMSKLVDAAQDEVTRKHMDAMAALDAKDAEIDKLSRSAMPAIMDAGAFWSTAQSSIADDSKRLQLDVARESRDRLKEACDHLKSMSDRLDKIDPASMLLAP